MEMNKPWICIFLVGLIVGMAFFSIFVSIAEKYTSMYAHGRKEGYRSGQIEALTGQIKYKTVTHKNQTVTWELIKK